MRQRRYSCGSGERDNHSKDELLRDYPKLANS
jgi:hypothetical protein